MHSSCAALLFLGLNVVLLSAGPAAAQCVSCMYNSMNGPPPLEYRKCDDARNCTYVPGLCGYGAAVNKNHRADTEQWICDHGHCEAPCTYTYQPLKNSHLVCELGYCDEAPNGTK